MSALDQVPEHVRTDLKDHRKALRLRDDLRIIETAERAGWKVAFRNDHWHNGAMFQRGRVHVWWSYEGWRRALLSTRSNRFIDNTVGGHGMNGLRLALDLVEVYDGSLC